MKLLLISDLHANIDALNAIWERESDSDVVLCVGDVVDWGFYPHETIAWLKERNAVVVYGNHDHEFLKQYDSGVREPLGQETTYMSHCINHTTEEDVAWLRALPEIAVVEYDGITYCLKHSVVLHERKSTIQQYLGEYRSIPAFRELWKQLVGSDDQKEKRIVIGESGTLRPAAESTMRITLEASNSTFSIGNFPAERGNTASRQVRSSASCRFPPGATSVTEPTTFSIASCDQGISVTENQPSKLSR
jgi:predicted phosphodiesterase